ncbi:hydroxyacid dehydrogenase [Sphingomonas canadensis]|uniref:Hydroxyacid dehydrogenase n=1 Tax=Sphingomonas canadensis TaxID=1219257 RepID=A0ABW3HD93_9SPHN|nr:hydroxyacid dehydrogenase [Sphingomonas canadensis]MCW3837295.1 hydroxyacid dehydrogenase [Sphingomonas canadensis]
MDIMVFEAEDWETEACAALTPAHHLRCTIDPLNQATAPLYGEAEIVTTFVDSRLDAATLSLLPKLRMIATRSTGFDHIDLDYCAQRKIAVSNVPSYGDVTVAEHVFTLLLALARNLVPTVEGARSGRFDQSDLRGIDLYGKTIGVIGTGRIGRRVIAIAKGFGMEVVAADLAPDAALGRELGFTYAELSELLRTADVISLNVPATASTRNLIGDTEFALMKPGAILINTARGNVVEVDALVRALTSGRLRAAGLDVLPQEPLMRDEAEIFRAAAPDAASVRELLANHILMSMPNVLVTPHVAYNTVEARRRIVETSIANIVAFAEGKPINLVGAG